MSKSLQSVCRFSLRWHQQFCHSSNLTGHKRCTEVLQSIRGYRQNVRAPRMRPARSTVKPFETESFDENLIVPEADIVVKEFEQDERDKKTLRRIDPNKEITQEMKEVRAQMEKLEKELAAMRQGPFSPQSDFMVSLPKNERDVLLQTLAKEGVLPGVEEDMLTMAELERLAEDDEEEDKSPQRQLGITLRIPKKDQAYVRHFNKALRAAQEANGNAQKSLVLWTWYLRCQQQIHNFSSIISEDVWKELWTTQVELKLRPKHLVLLAQDMIAAEQRMQASQWLEYIEALHASGDSATAESIWREQKSTFRTHSELGHSFWLLGVKLYAALGRPAKAQEIALNAVNEADAKPHILIPVIIAWAKSRGPEALVKAWACYLKLRANLASTITPDVFEDLSNAFLEADCADMALSVFKDMLLMQESSAADSQAVYRQATSHFEETMLKATTEEQINHIGLSALLILPQRFQNRFFYASWIKKLIGEGRIDSAAMVVELMYERGITPDTKPLNGIVGAWLREGSPGAQKKAETMALAMIDARAEVVQNRKAPVLGNTFRKILPPGDPGHARRPVFLRRQLPAATIETFSIMIQHYTRRSDYDMAERLTKKMIEECQIQPNAFIMNHWLYADLRASRIQDVWNKYQDLRTDITPDLETFVALWDTAKVQYSHMQAAHAKDFPSVRQLFAEMVRWSRTLTSHKLELFSEEFSPEIFAQIIRCFSLTLDLPGTLTAMHGLHQIFGTLPDDDSIRIICGQVARLIPGEQKGRHKASDVRARRSSSRHKNVLVQVVDIVETIEVHRKMALIDQGVDSQALQDPTSDASKHLRLAVMTEFMCMYMQKTQSGTGSYINDVKVAARTMGIDMDAVDLRVLPGKS